MKNQQSPRNELVKKLNESTRKIFNFCFFRYLVLLLIVMSFYSNREVAEFLIVGCIFSIMFGALGISYFCENRSLAASGNDELIKEKAIKYDAERKVEYTKFIINDCFIISVFLLLSELGTYVIVAAVPMVLVLGVFAQYFINSKLEGFTEEEKKYVVEYSIEKEIEKLETEIEKEEIEKQNNK